MSQTLKRIFKEEGYLKEVLTELKWISRYSLHFKKQIAVYLIFGALATGISFASGILSKKIIDTVTGFDTSAIVPAAVCYIVFELMTIGFNSLTNLIRAKINVTVEQDIRADIFDKIMQADWNSLIGQRSGDMLNRLNSDVSTVSSSVLGWIPDLITRLIQFFGAFGIIMYYDPLLAVISLMSAPFMALMSRTLLRKMRHYNNEMRKSSSELMSFSEESFRNIQMIKSFGLSEQYGTELRDVQKKYRELYLEYNRFSVGITTLLSVIGIAVYIICYGWCVAKLWNHDITYGTMTLFLQLSGTLGGAFSSVINMIPSAVSAATAAGRIMGISELPKEERSNEQLVGEILASHEPLELRAEKISFSYSDSDEPIFSEADFKAKPGEIIAVVGESGGGKTTLLRMILGLVPINGGRMYLRSAKFGDTDISPSTRRLFSYVPQENMMFAKSVADNLRLMKRDATDEELDEALKAASAYNFVYRRKEGLNASILESGGGFSKGQIQRLTIARALLLDTPIIMLDEATSALDIKTEQTVLKNIMQKREDRIILVTTHRPSVLKLCDRVYKLEDKKIRILDTEEIKELYESFQE